MMHSLRQMRPCPTTTLCSTHVPSYHLWPLLLGSCCCCTALLERFQHNLGLVRVVAKHPDWGVRAKAADHHCVEAAVPAHAIHGGSTEDHMGRRSGCGSGKVPDHGGPTFRATHHVLPICNTFKHSSSSTLPQHMNTHSLEPQD